jgi:hypothetical protein
MKYAANVVKLAGIGFNAQPSITVVGEKVDGTTVGF